MTRRRHTLRLAAIAVALSIAVACSSVAETAFDVWGVSDEGVPAYELVDRKESDGSLRAQIQGQAGWGETERKQVAAAIVEDERDGFDSIFLRFFGEGGQALVHFARTEAAADPFFRAGELDRDRASSAGYPLLVYSD